jgi:exopolysaccharide biosynthesis polyprenyl glycosylphosphotransferase
MTQVQMRGEGRLMRALCFSTDLLVFAFCLHVSSWTVVAFVEPASFPMLMRDRMLGMALFGAACVTAGCYRSDRLTDRFDAVYYLTWALATTFVAEFFLFFFLLRDSHVISRRELMLSAAIAVPFLAGWRFFAARFLVNHFRSLHRFYLVIGNPLEAKRIAETINRDAPFHAHARATTLVALRKRYAAGTTGQAVPADVPQDAIIAHTGPKHGTLTETIEMCDSCFERTFLYPSQHDAIIFQHHRLSSVAGIPLILVTAGNRNATYPYIKRAIDIGCAATGLLLAGAVLAATTLTIKLTSPGPIFFRQERLGRNGRTFKILKFRSMAANASGDDAPVRALRNDPRVTTVGRFIRKYKIDEIPQLWNVLRGDMSVVGPRPLWEDFFDKEPGATLWRKRLAVRPGLTSLAHVLSSSHFTPADILRYDLMYIKNLSFLTDLRVILATVRIVLSGKGGQ